MGGKREHNLLIWDAEVPHPVSGRSTVLWRSFAAVDAPGIISIPQLIEDKANALRERYLAWVYELGEMHIKDRRLVDHLQFRTGFSYWWMTLLVEKCNYSKSPQIDDAIRLLAFTDWVAGRSFDRVTLVSTNQPLAKCLRTWCEKAGVAFQWRRFHRPIAPLSWARRTYAVLPVVLQAWVWLLKYLLERWPLRGAGLQPWRQASGEVVFVSYLFNLVPEAANAGRYESRYWGHLPEVLQHEVCKTNWLHMYIKDELLPNAKKAAKIIRAFNEAGSDMEVHASLDTFLSAKIVFQVLVDWVKLVWKGRRLGGSISAAIKEPLDLWPLFAEDWRESTCGVTAMSNALHQNLFDAAIKALPKQKLGCYLQENQGWEFALIQSWKNANHGRLVGVPHSSVRFWDLRYFFDPRCYHQNGNPSIPLPDQVAVNGKAATDAHLAGGYPTEKLVQVEALRYLYLVNVSARPASKYPSSKQSLRLLVLGDYLTSNTRRQMRLLEQAATSLPTGTVITVKPHPACIIRNEDYPELDLNVVMTPIENLLSECDVAYTSAVTSAAMDAYCAGIPVVSVWDPTTLNMSPLRGFPGTFHASTASDLIKALKFIRESNFTSSPKENIFALNMTLPLWRQLLISAV